MAPTPLQERWTDPPWSPVLGQSLDLAEFSIASFYAIRPREWSTRFRYDIASCHDHPGLHFPRSSRAQIVRLDAEPPREGRFRIVLRDPELFELAERFQPIPVLTVTLAHEMVHLVRFGQGLASFELEGPCRHAEELRVRQITEEAVLSILPPADQPIFRAVLDEQQP